MQIESVVRLRTLALLLIAAAFIGTAAEARIVTKSVAYQSEGIRFVSNWGSKLEL